MVENEELVQNEETVEPAEAEAESSIVEPSEAEAVVEAAPESETPAESEMLTQPALVEDFSGIAESVYEAVMLAAQRARQIGKKQKREIDAWTRSLETTSSGDPDEESPDQGVDHFHHPKPTVQALLELKNQKFGFGYPTENS